MKFQANNFVCSWNSHFKKTEIATEKVILCLASFLFSHSKALTMYVIDLEWNACLGLKPYTPIIYLFLIFYCDVVIRQICELVSQSYTVETVRDVIWMSNNLGLLKLTDLIFELIFSQLCVIAPASNRLCTHKRIFGISGIQGHWRKWVAEFGTNLM